MLKYGLLLALLSSAAQAATLPEAIEHWTGASVDVIGAGPRVTVALPPSSPVPEFTTLAQTLTQAGDAGWRLTKLALPQPLHLRSGDTLTLHSQSADAWLGARTVQAQGSYGGIAIAHGSSVTRLDHASVALNSSGGPTTLALDFDGARLDRPAPLLPRQGTVRLHTTPAGAQALSALLAGRPAGPAPLTIDRAVLEIGPARVSAHGSVTLLNAHDRTGMLTLTAEHFGTLLRDLPTDRSTAAAYPVLMILRQMGQTDGDRVTWTVTFEGRHVLVSGLDVGALLGL